VASFRTDGDASVAEILAAMADRFALVGAFRDCNEVVGAGRQQVRFARANIGAFHIRLRTFAMTEARARGRSEGELVERSESPWDDPDRRPSHADERRAFRRLLSAEEIGAARHPGAKEAEIRALAERLLSWAA
jgi:hypothetical protein